MGQLVLVLSFSRKNSDDIRGALRHRLEIACQNDVVDQIQRNEQKRRDEEKRDQMWAQQWENDRKVNRQQFGFGRTAVQ